MDISAKLCYAKKKGVGYEKALLDLSASGSDHRLGFL